MDSSVYLLWKEAELKAHVHCSCIACGQTVGFKRLKADFEMFHQIFVIASPALSIDCVISRALDFPQCNLITTWKNEKETQHGSVNYRSDHNLHRARPMSLDVNI